VRADGAMSRAELALTTAWLLILAVLMWLLAY
jgi:hypothetical protein